MSAQAFWIIDQLVQQGVRCFCIAPGSRSTPLALAAEEHPEAQTIVHFDERAIGFYALGRSKGSGQVSAVIVTSGSALGNLYPSIMEASHSYTPCIFLTADRPFELQRCSANQTTDQTHLFAPFARWSLELPCEGEESSIRSHVCQAYSHALYPLAGPVQINCPFREPLYQPSHTFHPGRAKQFFFPKSWISSFSPWDYRNCTQGILLAGRSLCAEETEAIGELAHRLQWPLFADPLSLAKSSPEQIRHFDRLLCQKERQKPDLILHFGETLLSKQLSLWLETLECPYLHIDPRPALFDPMRRQTAQIQEDALTFCQRFRAEPSPRWLSYWKEQDLHIQNRILSYFQQTSPCTEPYALHQLSAFLPPFPLFLGNSMPVRDAACFLHPTHDQPWFANRGLSGIDGNLATAIGLSDGQDTPLVAILGDLTLLHDLNSLALLSQSKHPIYLIVFNNSGGGIFSHLPVHQSPHFHKLFALEHSWTFAKACEMFHIPYRAIRKNVETAYLDFFSQSQSSVLEIFTDRSENLRCHQEIRALCQNSLAFC